MPISETTHTRIKLETAQLIERVNSELAAAITIALKMADVRLANPEITFMSNASVELAGLGDELKDCKRRIKNDILNTQTRVLNAVIQFDIAG